MKILFVVPYPLGTAPSQRFRFEHYLKYLEAEGIQYKVEPFWDSAAWKILYKPGNNWKKFGGLLRGLARRFRRLFLLRSFDFVYIHREATAAGPAWFEWMITHLLRKKLIYDFDDAIWIPATSINNRKAIGFRNFSKVKNICRWATTVVTGNAFLAEYASRYNNNVKVIPTVVNTDEEHNLLQEQMTGHPAIGWTGSHSTLPYIDRVLPVIRKLQDRHSFRFVVIADKDPGLVLSSYKFVPWNRETEARDLLNFHIGLMPLDDNEISKGKCGFKAIQYMSAGIPAVVSPVGVNTEIVDDGINGYTCSEEKEWEQRLEELLNNATLRQNFGKAAREKIVRKYSVAATVQEFIGLFQNNTI